jgi:Tfp pilus assembly protein PilZ
LNPISKSSSKADRRYQRISTPKGVWVAWNDGNQQQVSRVRDLNRGGLFIATIDTLPLGAIVTILLAVPEGEIRSSAVVRNTTPKEGIGVQFTNMDQQNGERLDKLIARLLPASADTPK